MATITDESQLHDPDGWPIADDLGDRYCLLCGEPAKIPFIFYKAADDKWIVLHPECTERFAWGLLRDGWELKLGRREANIRYYTLGNLCGNVKPPSVIKR